MHYQKYSPNPSLRSFIQTYYIWENPDNANVLTIESPPSAYTAMVFNLGEPFLAGVYGGKLYQVPLCFFTGQATQSYTLKLSGKIFMIGVVLKATSFYHFTGLDQKPFLNKRADLFNIMGNKAKKVYEQLKNLTNRKKMITLLDQFFLQIIAERKIVRDEVDKSVDIIDDQHGNLKLANLQEKVSLSPRYFQKVFTRRIGVSPKSYMRLRRMSHICFLLSTKKEINWHDLVYEGGYFDQSHFIKDFMDFIGRNPSLYFKHNNELARLVRSIE